METFESRTSVIGLVRNLSNEVSTFIRQEINLAKTEITEKLSAMGKNAVTLAIGGVIVYAGLVVLLIGLGVLAAWGLQTAGLEPFVAGAAGVGGVGLLITIIGAILLLKGMKAFSKESLKPEKTMQTLQELKTRRTQTEPLKEDARAQSSDELRAGVEVTESMMSDTLGELGYRLSPSHIKAQVGNKISDQPYKYGVVAMGVGLISGLWMKSRFFRRASYH